MGDCILPIVITMFMAFLLLLLAAESIELFLNMAHDIRNMADDVKESNAALKSYVRSQATKRATEAGAAATQEEKTS